MQEKDYYIETDRITGQPNPLTVTFKELQDRALRNPIMKEDWKPTEVDLLSHSRVFDYANTQVMAIVILVVKKGERFAWNVQIQVISKALDKPTKLAFLRTKQKQDISKMMKRAFAGIEYAQKAKTKHNRNSYIWEIFLSDAEIVKMRDFGVKVGENNEQ